MVRSGGVRSGPRPKLRKLAWNWMDLFVVPGLEEVKHGESSWGFLAVEGFFSGTGFVLGVALGAPGCCRNSAY